MFLRVLLWWCLWRQPHPASMQTEPVTDPDDLDDEQLAPHLWRDYLEQCLQLESHQKG